MYLKYTLLIFFLFNFTSLSAQSDPFGQKYSVEISNGSLINAIDQLRSINNDISIVYQTKSLNKYYIDSFSFEEESLHSILKRILKGIDLEYELIGTTIVIRKQKKSLTLYGEVVDDVSGRGIPYALVAINKRQYTMADYDGRYNLPLEKGDYRIAVTSVNYSDSTFYVNLSKDLQLNLILSPNNLLQEVIIKSDSIKPHTFHYKHFGSEHLQRLTYNTPGLGGVHDIMHTVRALPGIQSGAGGIGGHFVRGSGNSENLILIEGATMYYPYHAFGLTSILDPKFVKDLQINKSSFNPKYGGRSASVLDVRVRNGNVKKWNALSSISPEIVDIMIDGPIINEKLSLVAYGRINSFGSVYENLINKNILSADDGSISFYNFLGKLTYKLSDDHQLTAFYMNYRDNISSFQSGQSDRVKDGKNGLLNWGSEILSVGLKSNLAINTRFNFNISNTSYFSSISQLFQSQIDFEQSYYEFNSSASENSDFKIEPKISFLNNWLGQNIDLGISINRQAVRPRFRSSFLDDDLQGEELYDIDDLEEFQGRSEVVLSSWENSVFLNARKQIGKLDLEYGVRMSHFSHSDATYSNFEPRLSAAFDLDYSNAFTISVAKMVQYLHLISSSSINIPRDIWIPSNEKFRPLRTWHFDVGWHRVFKDFYLDINSYYKRSDGVHQFNGLSNFEINDQEDFDDVKNVISFKQGLSQSYGLEVQLTKNVGKLQGLFSYSLSRSFIQIDGYNRSNAFDFQFDRRHEFKLISTYSPLNNLNMGISFYFGTGHPEIVIYEPDLQSLYQVDFEWTGNKNMKRIPNTVRLDLSMQYHFFLKKSKHHLKLSVYNVTNENNPLFYIENINDMGRRSTFSVDFFPTLQYTLKF